MDDPEPDAPNKRMRLFAALCLEQDFADSGGPVTRFIEAAMRPLDYAIEPEVFEARRGRLNTVLAICGLTLSGVFRNTIAHEPKVSWPISEQDALDLLSLVSYMHRRLDKAIPRRVNVA
jgi:hypothetical protein